MPRPRIVPRRSLRSPGFCLAHPMDAVTSSRVSIQVQQLLDLEKAQRIVPARHEEVRHINVERDIVDGYRVLSQWCGWALVRADSPVEGDGFELLVPRYDGRSILEISSRSRGRLRPGFSRDTLQDDRVPSTGETHLHGRCPNRECEYPGDP